MREKTGRLVWAIIAFVLFLMLLSAIEAEANAGGGSATTDRIGRGLTVQEIEMRADINWSLNTAQEWNDEDAEFCANLETKFGSPYEQSKVFSQCMINRLTLRLLFMLRRDCTGLSAISEVCGTEVK